LIDLVGAIQALVQALQTRGIVLELEGVLELGGVLRAGDREFVPAARTALQVVLVVRCVVLGASGSGRAN
jgi:uncharacterized protein (DUF697 family)